MRQYSREFKVEALKLSEEIGLKKTSLQLGIPYFTLADWRNRGWKRIMGEEKGEKGEKQKESQSEQEERIRELERENAELRTANEILKDALGFFAKDRKK